MRLFQAFYCHFESLHAVSSLETYLKSPRYSENVLSVSPMIMGFSILFRNMCFRILSTCFYAKLGIKQTKLDESLKALS